MGYDVATSITLDPSGNVFVTGVFDSYSIHFGSITLYNAGPHTDLFIAKLDDTTGRWLWARRAGGIGYEGGASVKSSLPVCVYILDDFNSDILP